MVIIEGIRSLSGELRVPGDKSISHRALMIAALSKGTSVIRGLSSGLDVDSTHKFIEKLGAEVTSTSNSFKVEGNLVGPLFPSEVIDAGNSGTLMRIGAGMVAGLGGNFQFTGDSSLNSRPMGRIFSPLREMGARISTSRGDDCAPFALESTQLSAIRYQLPVPSAQVKSSILFAGLGAEGVTTVVEKIPTRRHSEEMLAAAGAKLNVVRQGDVSEISIQPSRLEPLSYDIPGDPSQAAYWIVAALIIPKSEIVVKNVYIGELRSDFIDVLKRMGGDIQVDMHTVSSGDIYAKSSQLKAANISGAELAGLIDEIPILAVAAARAEGVTTIRNAEELRVKESDRISMMVSALRSFGLKVWEYPDGMDIEGSANVHGGSVDAKLDHRIAMSCAILACAVDGNTEIAGFDSVASSYPNFLNDLQKLQMNSRSR